MNACVRRNIRETFFILKCLGKHYKHSIFLVSIKADKCLVYVIFGALSHVDMKH